MGIGGSGDRKPVRSRGLAIDIVEIPVTVDVADEPAHCGLFLLTRHIAVDRIEPLIVSGGHGASWEGEANTVLRVPRGVLADSVLLFSEPYCSDHVPQPGDCYGTATLNGAEPLTLRLNQRWRL